MEVLFSLDHSRHIPILYHQDLSLFMLRDAFHLPKHPDAIELRAFTHGLMPKSVPTMVGHFLEDWQNYGVDAWNEVPNHWLPASGEQVGWWDLPAYLGDRFIAPLLGAPSGTCIMQPNAHWTVQCLLSARELFQTRKRVVMCQGDFPSVRFSVQQWAEVYGLDICTIALDGDTLDKGALLDSIDDNTALVCLSHVGFTTGEKVADTSLKQIAEKTRSHGCLLAVDGYHAIGSTATSIQDLHVDVYFGGLLKEGCGSSGNAFVYIRQGLELTPRTTGWFGDGDPFSFSEKPAAHPEVRRRFLGGTTAIASLYHAVEGIRLLLEAGLSAIQIDLLSKTTQCIQLIDQLGLQLRSPRDPERRSAMVILEIPHADRLSAYLKSLHIYTDSRQGRFLRMAPFVWNTEDEINRAFEAIGEAVKEGAYLQHILTHSGGPVT